MKQQQYEKQPYFFEEKEYYYQLCDGNGSVYNELLLTEAKAEEANKENREKGFMFTWVRRQDYQGQDEGK